MRLLVLAVITLLAAPTAAYAQQLEPKEVPKAIHYVNTRFEDAITFFGRQAGIEIQWDETVRQSRRNAKITLRMEKVTFEEMLDGLTSRIGLSYRVVDAHTIRIYLKQ